MPERLLLVDDEAGIRKVMSITLADMGYDVRVAESGQEALTIFREFHPAIVLTDIKMPGMDGVELLQKIKSERPDTEVIMVTGHGDMELAITSLKLEAADFITKPVSQDALEVALKRTLDKIGMRRQLRTYTEQLEDLAREKSERYQQIFDQAPCYITVQDREHRITEANRAFQGDFCAGPGAICYQVYKHRQAPCDDCPVEKTFATGQPHSTEEVVTDCAGTAHNVLINTTPIRNASGEISHVMEMSTDITEIRQLQDHLTTLGLLLGSVSHGVKGMLTALDGGIYRLESGLKRGDEEKTAAGLDTVKDLSGRIKTMVLDILSYAKSRELNWQEVDVADLAQHIVALIEPKAEKANVGFSADIPASLGSLQADSCALIPALVNFLENAVDACVAHGVENPLVEFLVAREDEHMVFTVRDNGMGMDRETREKIFTLFFSSKGRKGTGLGLFISHKAVLQHGGGIQVESEPGQGATFTIRLPLVLPPSVRSHQDDGAPPGAQPLSCQ